MEKEYVKTQALDIIRSVKDRVMKQEHIVILDSLAEVIDALEPDRAYLENRTRARNILKEKAASILKGKKSENAFNPEDIYMLNRIVMKNIAGRVSTALCELEQQRSDESERQKKRINELQERLNESEALRRKFNDENENIRMNVALNSQIILSITRDNPKISREIASMLNKLGISVVWSSEASSPEMFEVLKVENLEAYREKPCLIHDGKILLNGTRFESVKGDK